MALNFSADQYTPDVTVKSKNYHKQILCNLCGKYMRDNNLKRHMKAHADISKLDDNDLRIELQKRNFVEHEKKKTINVYKRLHSKKAPQSIHTNNK